MGKAKKNVQEDNYTFVVDLKTVLACKPDQRVKWLSKACRAVSDGDASVKHVFDVLTSKKLIIGMPFKAGQRMLRVLKENLYLFSEKQQRYLSEESVLATEFGREPSDDEKPGAGNVAPTSNAGDSTGALDAASKMEEMMARCRDFVRQKASGFEERTKEAEEAEQRAIRERQRALEEQRAREWAAIADWHKDVEAWEVACMAQADERLARLLALQRRADAEAAEAAAAGQAALTAAQSTSSAGSGKRRRRSPSSSDEDQAAVFRQRGSQRSRRGDRGASSRSRTRSRRQRSRSPAKDKDKDAERSEPPAPSRRSPAAEEPRRSEGTSSRRRFREAVPQQPEHRVTDAAVTSTLSDLLRGTH